MLINENIVLKTEDALVRTIEIFPETEAPWHYHTEVIDDCFCLEGIIEVQIKNPDQTISLAPGERCTINTGRVHRVANATKEKSKYLLVQGVGKYDFITIDL